MFCAFSQFLDRHVHWSDSSGTNRSAFSEIKRRFWETNVNNITNNDNNNNNSSSSSSNTAATATPSPSSSISNSNNSNNGSPLHQPNEINHTCPGTPQRHNRRHLPIPSGDHTVGCVDFMCDVDLHGSFFRLYYPTQKTDIHRHYKQWPLWLPRKQYVHGYMHFLKRNKKIFGRLANFVAGDLYVPVLWQAPLLRSDEKFPVVIISHGLGGNRTTLTTYCYELASHGFVVVAFEHRDGSASMTLCLQEDLTSSLREPDNENDDRHNNNHKIHHRLHHHPYLRYFHLPHHHSSHNTSSKHHHSSSKSHEQNCDKSNLDNGDSAVQCYLEEGKESRDGHGGRGMRVLQRRQDGRRSLRHNHSCSEEWRPFNHIMQWDDFDYRNGQMYHRVDEISDLFDELVQMNEGADINNALGISFRTGQFKGRLDFSRLALIGHSFGAAACLATMATDDRFKVGISLDGWLHPVDEWVDKSCKQPVMFLNMGDFQWERNVNRMIKFQNANTSADRPMITLLGGCHQSVSDFQFMVPNIVGRFMEVCSTLRPELSMSACVDASLAFLYKHLNLPMELKYEEVLKCNHPHLMSGTNVDLSVPDDGPQPPPRIRRSIKEDLRASEVN